LHHTDLLADLSENPFLVLCGSRDNRDVLYHSGVAHDIGNQVGVNITRDALEQQWTWIYIYIYIKWAD
jgi:hypothetical protein